MEYQASGLQSLVNKTRGIFVFWCVIPLPEEIAIRLKEAGVLKIRKNSRNVRLSCYPDQAKVVGRFLEKQSGVRKIQRLTDVSGSYEAVFLFKGHVGEIVQALIGKGIRGWTIS